MKDVTRRVYIYSTYQKGNPERVNIQSMIDEQLTLEDIGIESTLVRGAWGGAEEESLLVVGSNTLETTISERAKLYNQDAYLVVYDDNAVELVQNTGKRKFIGQWVNVGTVKPQGDWTYNFNTNNYYQVKG